MRVHFHDRDLRAWGKFTFIQVFFRNMYFLSLRESMDVDNGLKEETDLKTV